MSKEQVEKILGPPTTQQTKQALVFAEQSRWEPVITYRYEEANKFVTVTFKNDRVDAKDSNLGREP